MSGFCECLRSSLFSERRELKRYRRNWINLFAGAGLGGVCYFIAIPSLHQFVTSSKNPTPTNDNVRPGLGLSETWYTWIISISSIGELLGAVVYGVLSRRVYVKWLLLSSILSAFLGGLLFGIGKYGWMLLIGRFLIGLFQGSQQTLWRLYIGETSERAITFLPEEKRKKSTIKYTNFFIAFATASTNVAVGPSLAAIVAQIPKIDQFRWSGWFICIVSLLLFSLTLFLFREKWEDINRTGGRCGIQDMRVPLYVIVFIILAFILMNWQFAILDTLLNPILSDNFGLDIKYISYIFMSFLAFYIVASTTVYIFQQCHVNIRLICLLAFSLSISGSLVLIDWQALRGPDPCTDDLQEPTYSNSTIEINFVSFVILTSSEENDGYTVRNITHLHSESSLISCDTTCDNQQQSCDSLGKVAQTITITNGSSVCMWDRTLLCYQTIDQLYFELEPDNVLNVYYETVIETQDASGNFFNGGVHNDKAVLILHHPQSLNYSNVCIGNNIDHWSQCDFVNNTAQCNCEESSNQCFWNPSSRLTGQYCERCRPVCLSKEYSLSFPQLMIGVMLLAPGYPMGRISLSILASDGLGKASQGPVMGTMVAAGAIARFTGPLWGNPAYLFANHRTWLPMSILSILQGIVLIIFLALYKKMHKKQVFELIKDVTFDHEGDDPDIELTSYSEPDGVRLLAFDTLNEKDKDGNTHVDDGDTTLDNDISCSDEEQLLHASVRQP